jgi:hypothetical protein
VYKNKKTREAKISRSNQAKIGVIQILQHENGNSALQTNTFLSLKYSFLVLEIKTSKKI